MAKAVAVDLGAGSGRIAIGEFRDGQIHFKVVRQIAHEPVQEGRHLRWDFPLLLNLAAEAAEIARREGASSVGIDSWGVDHGYLDQDGKLIQDPICYRDLSHLAAFEALAPHRSRLYELTGTQHQPFNTICQLVARRKEDPDFSKIAVDWLILPDLLGYLLTGERFSEVTQASTTQLLGLDGNWSAEAFEIAQWPFPERPPASPGIKVGRLKEGVDLISVGSHDTASAVAGFGTLEPGDLFLNVGTWSLCGVVIPLPIATARAEELGFTNERTVDGQIRLLKNIPGFYFINRLHHELKVESTVPEWLESDSGTSEFIDLFHPDFFNPESMLKTSCERLGRTPKSHADWSAIALNSLSEAVVTTAKQVQELTGIRCRALKIAGGGSRSGLFCHKLSQRLKVPVVAGPSEATVLGNLAAQFLGQGEIEDWKDLFTTVDRSIERIRFVPH